MSEFFSCCLNVTHMCNTRLDAARNASKCESNQGYGVSAGKRERKDKTLGKEIPRSRQTRQHHGGHPERQYARHLDRWDKGKAGTRSLSPPLSTLEEFVSISKTRGSADDNLMKYNFLKVGTTLFQFWYYCVRVNDPANKYRTSHRFFKKYSKVAFPFLLADDVSSSSVFFHPR